MKKKKLFVLFLMILNQISLSFCECAMVVRIRPRSAPDHAIRRRKRVETVRDRLLREEIHRQRLLHDRREAHPLVVLLGLLGQHRDVAGKL
jgi:hypothetical protein